jgi:hypothetical protein
VDTKKNVNIARQTVTAIIVVVTGTVPNARLPNRQYGLKIYRKLPFR